MNWLDGIVAAFSPERGARRLAYRARLEISRRAYDAARRDHKTLSWRTGGSSANAEVAVGEIEVRNRSRDLLRNNGYALQIVHTIADHIVGSGIVAAPTGIKGNNLKKVTDARVRWEENCDFEGDHDYFGLLWLAAKSMLESGACLIRLRRVEFGASTLIVPLRLQLLEVDFIDTLKNGTTENGGLIDRGIEYDRDGRKIAYWLFETHPGDQAIFRRGFLQSTRIPASEIIYLYDKLRPGQDRGMPVLAPAVMPLRDLDGYFQAELTRKRIEACLAGFITTDSDDGLPLDTSGTAGKTPDGITAERFTPGMITRLRSGENITIAQPANAQGVSEFAMQYLRMAAASAGVMYEHATGDFSNVNYSSWRAGHHGFRRRMERLQWHVMVHKLARPITAAYDEAARAAGMMPAQSFLWRHTPPGFISVDPYKDAQADLLNLRMGKVTLSQLVEERGYDYVEMLNQLAADLAAADTVLGQDKFDGDPRKKAPSQSNNQQQST